MKVERRDIFKLAGGAVVGTFLTPIPWKLLDDTSIWSQNWSWIPRPLKGEIKTKFSNCTLCPAGCGVKIRCVKDQPVSVSGVRQHPISRGVLCPVGVTGHQLAYHPARVRQATHKGAVTTIDGVALSAATAIKGSHGSVAILDARPGRAVSNAYRAFLAQLPKGVYLQPPQREGATLEALAELSGKPGQAFGIDLENTRTLLSFGAPILDGWGTPGRAMQCRNKLKLIQAESRKSRTALLADVWLPVKPGTERALALGLANVIIAKKLFPLSVGRSAENFNAHAELVARYTPEFVSAITGLSAQSIVETATALATNGPAVAIGGGDPGGGPLGHETELAIASLNLLLGSVGVSGGIVARLEGAPAKTPTEIVALPDGSISVLITDTSSNETAIPWPLLRRKLAANPLIVSLTAFQSGIAQHAEYVVPTPAYLESMQDLPVPFDSSVASFAVSAPAYPLSEGSIEPVQFLAKIAANAGLEAPMALTESLKNNAEAIRKSARGELFTYSDAASRPVKDAGSAEEFWKALSEGACWVDAKSPNAPPARFSLLAKITVPATPVKREFPLALMPFGWRDGIAQSSPLISKIYQESGLREPLNSIRINPETAATAGVTDASVAVIETPAGATRCMIIVDKSVQPGVLEAATGAQSGVLDITEMETDATWRVTSARIRRA